MVRQDGDELIACQYNTTVILRFAQDDSGVGKGVVRPTYLIFGVTSSAKTCIWSSNSGTVFAAK